MAALMQQQIPGNHSDSSKSNELQKWLAMLFSCMRQPAADTEDRIEWPFSVALGSEQLEEQNSQ